MFKVLTVNTEEKQNNTHYKTIVYCKNQKQILIFVWFWLDKSEKNSYNLTTFLLSFKTTKNINFNPHKLDFDFFPVNELAGKCLKTHYKTNIFLMTLRILYD